MSNQYRYNIFCLVDSSGSIESSILGSINYAIREIFNQFANKTHIMVVTYANNATFHKQSKDALVDIKQDLSIDATPYRMVNNEKKNISKSNLGKCYQFLKNHIDANSIPILSCIFILFSDGDSTDNYKSDLENLLNNQINIFRLGVALSSNKSTLNIHSTDSSSIFSIHDTPMIINKLNSIIL